MVLSDIEADYREQRERMARSQIEERGISDKRVLSAMRNVPRHKFVPEELKESAYSDFPLPIGVGQTISQPYMVALMTELLELSGGERVLEVGTGSGYQCAVLCELSGKVYSIEVKEMLAERAIEALKDAEYDNFEVIVGNGACGYPEGAPFDRIIVTAGAEEVPEELVRQLKVGGIMVIPVGGMFYQELVKIKKTEHGLKEESITPCVFVPLL